VVLDISEQRLYASEPTTNHGKDSLQVMVEIDTEDPDKPIVDIIGDIKYLESYDIEGVLLHYSIR